MVEQPEGLVHGFANGRSFKISFISLGLATEIVRALAKLDCGSNLRCPENLDCHFWMMVYMPPERSQSLPLPRF